MKWSLSSHRTFRRCQRQYFFKHMAANHAAKKDPLRREAFLLNQSKPLSTWQGLLVHQGIKEFLVPELERGGKIDWPAIERQTIDMAHRQFDFSRKNRHRERGLTKTACGNDYCALMLHDRGETIPLSELERVCDVISCCFRNLSGMDEFLGHVRDRKRYWAELTVSVPFEGASVHAVLDLLFPRSYGHLSIVDWKVEQDESRGDHSLQTSLYAWALHRHDKWRVERPEHIELIEVQLLQGRFYQTACTGDRFDELEDLMYKSIHEIKALCRDHRYETQDLSVYEYAGSPNSCMYCAFNRLCREVNHGNTHPQLV